MKLLSFLFFVSLSFSQGYLFNNSTIAISGAFGGNLGGSNNNMFFGEAISYSYKDCFDIGIASLHTSGFRKGALGILFSYNLPSKKNHLFSITTGYTTSKRALSIGVPLTISSVHYSPENYSISFGFGTTFLDKPQYKFPLQFRVGALFALLNNNVGSLIIGPSFSFVTAEGNSSKSIFANMGYSFKL